MENELMVKTPKIEAMLREAIYRGSDFYVRRIEDSRKKGKVIRNHDLTIECIGNVARNIIDYLKRDGNYRDVRREFDMIMGDF